MLKKVFKKRSFWVAILDAGVGVAALLLPLYLAPDKVALTLSIWGFIQAPLLIILKELTVDDIAKENERAMSRAISLSRKTDEVPEG